MDKGFPLSKPCTGEPSQVSQIFYGDFRPVRVELQDHATVEMSCMCVTQTQLFL